MPYRMIQVGTGGFGASWCERFLPPSVADGFVEVVAAVDVRQGALLNAQEHLGLPLEKCYTDVGRAFDETPADFCTVVVPPARHESIVDAALAHDMHILSEKPIADSLEASVRIAGKVRAAGKKMGVTMSHRFDQDKTSIREELRSGRHGALDYVVFRSHCACRAFGSWGQFRHKMQDPQMVEGAVHHLDIIADLGRRQVRQNLRPDLEPPWGEYEGDSQALVMMDFENGTRAVYEGAKTAAVGLNCWGNEYIRAECEGAILILSRRQLECFPHGADGVGVAGTEGQGTPVPLREQARWSHQWLIEKFVNWLDGGEPMETNVEDNLQSVALVFAAIESSRTGRPIKVQEKLRACMAEGGA